MIRQIVFTGDSTSQGTVGFFNITAGGQGCWYELVAERLANIVGVGPLISSGFRGCHLSFLSEWTAPATTTAVVSSNPYDVYPYTGGRWSNGVSNVWTWTKSVRLRPIIGFAIYWVDKTNGGNWQYRIDGGTWTNMNQTLNQNNKLCKFYVSSPITSKLDIRGSSDGINGVDCFPAGIEAYYVDPLTATQGLIAHCIAVNGSTLHQLTATTSGDRMAFLNNVQLGTGSPVAPTPNAGVFMMHINDVAIDNTTTWGTDLTTLNTRASPLGPVGFINIYEANNSVYPNQAGYRAKTKTTAAGFATPVKVYDIYDAWSANGWTGLTAETAAGLLYDLVHESQAGHLDIATRIYWFIRNKFFNISATIPSIYVAAALQEARMYIGNRAVVAYKAGAPISIK